MINDEQMTTPEAILDVAIRISELANNLSNAIGGHEPIEPKTGFIAHPKLKPVESVAEAIVFTGEAIDRHAGQTLCVANSITEAAADIAAAIQKLAHAIEYAASPQD